jgi:hypothetical protein
MGEDRMQASEIFSLAGHDGRTIPATYWQNSETKAEKLAVIFPGYRYPADGPLTFYLKLLFDKQCCDILTIDYRYNENRDFLALNDNNKDRYFENDQYAIYDFIKKTYPGKSLVFIGKSLGTSAVFEIAKKHISDPFIRNSVYIWLTPAVKNREIIELCLSHRLKSFYLIGDSDPFFDGNLLEDLPADTFRIKIIPGAGHILESGTELPASIDNLKAAVAWIEGELQSFI